MNAKTKRRILAALAVACLVLPVTGWYASSLRDQALRAKTRAQFSQWSAAMENFQKEYGFFPAIDGTYSGGGGSAKINMVNPEKFSVALTGRKLDGTDVDLRVSSATAEKKVGNTKLIQFYISSDPTGIQDAFGNDEIGVLYDKNGDGKIDRMDLRTVPDISPKGRPGQRFSPEIDLGKGLNVPVAFYSAGKGRSSADIIYSWK